MKLSGGIFKENYRGYAVYWDGCYNVNGDGQFESRQAARAAIDKAISDLEQWEKDEAARKVEQGYMPAKRDGDNVTIVTPDGPRTMTIRQWRNGGVDDVCDEFDRDFVWVNEV